MGARSEFVSLIDAASARAFEPTATPDVWRAAERGEGFAALWRAIEESGFLDVLGADASDAEAGAAAFCILRNAGRSLVPAPVGETMAARAALRQAGMTPPPGPLAINAARAAYGRHAIGMAAWQDGRLAFNRTVTAKREDVNVALEPRDDLKGSDAILGDPGWSEDKLPAWGAMIRATQMAGAIERALSLTVDYARTRKQFGKPIGQFQAIQQQLAVLACQAAAASTAAAYAWRSWNSPALPMLAAAAKIRAGETAGAAISISHQTFGAIGITEEHELHFTTRRLHAWRAEFGGESAWSMALGQTAARLGPSELWAAITRQ